MAKKTTVKKAKAVSLLAVPIRISVAGVVLDRVVKMKKRQDLIWIAQDGGGPWTITFDTSPFSESTYRVPRGGSVRTTGGAANGAVGKTYRYTVKDETGRITGEGEVIIE